MLRPLNRNIVLSIIIFFSIDNANCQNELKTSKPNIILIVADDLGYGDLGFTGSKQLKTPNLDALANSGVQCTQGYVSSAVCSPSRAGFLTGINQVEFGYDNNLGPNQHGFDPEDRGLPLGISTIGDYLQDEGYVTGLVGKWHLGYEDQFYPTNRGFDEFWGYRGGGHDYFIASPEGKGYKVPIECNYKKPKTLTYLTDDKGDECVDFIRRHADNPFFLFASFNAPHTPMQALEKDMNLFSHIKDNKRRIYAAMVYRLDINIGRIINEVKEQGLDQRTMIVFLSDNGGPVHVNSSLNAPYRGQKGILLEGGIHVPFVISWPGHLREGSLFDEPVSSLDLAPTFLSIAEAEVEADRGFSGVNLIPFLTTGKEGLKNRQMKWRFTISAAIREGDWKLIRLPDRFPQLYDLSTDITEENDRAMHHLDKTRDLLKKLGNWDVHLPHPLFLEGPMWRARQLGLYEADYPLLQPK